ncbi:MAG: ABC transporter ATP-binding protein [Bryobacteraceae bacterium]
MGSLIEARGLRYRYEDGTEALRGVDFDLDPGETVILLGGNGSGKTTFVLHLNGLLRGEGEVRVCGMAMGETNLASIRRKVGVVFQDADEQLFMPTVLEDAAYGLLNLGYSRGEARSRASAALDRVGIGHCAHRAPYHLSGGEKRRAAIAGVLAMEPEILVLDEPTTSLDPPGQRELVELLRTLPQAKIVTTHDTGLARGVGTRAVFFEAGRVAGSGEVADVLNRFDWEAYRDREASR